ncbi:hypothetical protein COLO4_20210 [Corchorus olitorius]|uniref:Leucine-rich repeat-containing N-terminal plant-type domain-containing protein n=1 Tax=Corchorus olitorius TaxID=93759 RepID=A0A1R3J165_9ROSI|nr:hypothetical protein COLO4_20210 [Corchorus olitorius]
MGNLRIPFLLFATLILLSSSISFVLCISQFQTSHQNHCLDDQRSALVELQLGLYHSHNFTNFSSKAELWDHLTTDCCTWKGVTCDGLGHVIGLDVSYRNLSGSFQSIFNLHHLQKLNLAGNNFFNNSLFPSLFERLANLTHLNLSASCFHGQIPLGFSYLTRLVSLDLSFQDMCYWRYYLYESGYYDFPALKLEKPNLETMIKNMSSLTELYLDRVNISTQSSDWCETISLSLPKLRVLSLSRCGLTEIFLSPKMQRLDISDNFVLGGVLPEFPINNSSLQVLSLFGTNFSGKLPESIGNLKLLTSLAISSRQFSGPIPSSIANLSNLVVLFLDSNNFSGQIPPFHRSGVPNLSFLSLCGNSLSGSIPSIFTLPSLRGLDLSGNQLDGEIDEFTNSSSSLIQYVYLSENHLRGSIPDSIFHLPMLEELDIGYNSFDSMKLDLFFQINNLRWLELSNISLLIGSDNNKSLILPQLEGLSLRSCNLTEFPEFIKAQDKLADLDLSNNQIHGFVPNWLWKLPTLSDLSLSFNAIDFPKQIPFGDANSSFPMLQRLDLRSCNIKAAQLRILRVSDNRLEGKLPTSLANCTKLMVLDVGNNTMYDSFPFWLGKLPALEVLVLWENRFYGEIEHLVEHGNVFPALDVLDIASNNFSGEVVSLDFLQATQLRTLKIGGNKFQGKLPTSFANCTKLEVLDLGNNMVHDTFPYWLEKVPSLKVLILRGNRFYGTIESSGISENVFPMLRILDIASNNFSGVLPIQFFQSLRGMMQITDGSRSKPDYIGEDYYQDSVTIVNKGFEILYEKILTILAGLDISNNNFHGPIPEEVKYLKSLKMLNFSHNSFYGPVPALEDLTELESLDLSSNNLSGKIPAQLTSLTFLAALNLSYNQLEGSIPQSNQFNTFTNDSYQGNPRLCGPPLTRRCNEVSVPTPPPTREDVESWGDGISVWKIGLIGYASGLVIGLSVGFTVLNEFGNRWLDNFTRNKKRRRRRSR